MQHIFLVGAKSLGAYGGYESFVYKLTEYHQSNPKLKYHVACKANGEGSMDESKLDGVKIISDNEFTFHNAHCFKIKVPQIGPAQAIYYDVAALQACCRYIRENHIEHPIVYIMTCRIGPFAHHFYNEIHRLGGKVFLNPDGHEWLRRKWSLPIRKYWKISESRMVRYSDLIVCDSINIERYIKSQYQRLYPKTTYISYGAELGASALEDDAEIYQYTLQTFGLTSDNYYIIVCRLVPENNIETILREFMNSSTSRKLAVVTNTNDKFYNYLEQKLHISKDPRIVFTGPIYNPALLQKLRENAYAYLHGHEVGGTNPSLLEALSATKLNLILDVAFNREVSLDTALYWTKEDGNLKACLELAEKMTEEERIELGKAAKERIRQAYSWPQIAAQYEEIWKQSQKG